MKEIEGSVQKWRKNKKDLEFQMDNISKCQQEIKEKMSEKTSDLKCINLEIADLNKRIENNKNDIDATNKSFTTKKNASSVSMVFRSLKKYYTFNFMLFLKNEEWFFLILHCLGSKFIFWNGNF